MPSDVPGNVSYVDRLVEQLRASFNVSSDAELARALGVDSSSICMWRSRGRVPDKYVAKLAVQTDTTGNTPPSSRPLMRKRGGDLAFRRELGTRLRNIRGARKLHEFARSLGLATNTLGRYERGEIVPSAWFIAVFAGVTGADLYELLGLEGRVPASSETARLEAVLVDFVNKFRGA